MTQPTPAQPDYSKFEGLTKLVLEQAPERAASVEDRITFAWADHVRNAANKDNHGKGLGEAMYSAAETYVREDMYGLSGALPGNENFQTQAQALFARTLGVTKAQLADTFKDSKVVHRGQLDGITEQTSKSMVKAMQEILGTKLGNLGDGDLEAFRGYVLKTATDVGATKVKAESMPTLHAAQEQYLRLLPLVQQYRGMRKAAESYGPAAQA